MIMATKPQDKPSKMKQCCHICDKIIVGSTYKFKSHLYHHSEVPPRFICSSCPKAFYRRDIYNKHVDTHKYKLSQRKKFVCDHCGRGFVYKNNLILHLTKIHDDVPNARVKKFKCMACGATYCEQRLLKFHIRKQHFNLQQQESNHLDKRVNETWVEPVKQTNICVQMTKVNNNIIEIKKCNTLIKLQNDYDRENSVLSKYFTSKYAYENKSNYSKAVCDYCKKEMLKKSLVAHIRERHLRCRRFHCNMCGRDFNRRYQLIDHMCGKIVRRRQK